jgi:hypothetical protein
MNNVPVTADVPEPKREPIRSDFRFFVMGEGHPIECSGEGCNNKTFGITESPSALTLTCTRCRTKTVAIVNA